MSGSSTGASLGSQLTQVLQASLKNLSEEGKKQAGELSKLFKEQAAFQKSLAKDEKWKTFYTQASDDADLGKTMVAAATAISNNADPGGLLQAARSAFEGIKKETEQLQKAEQAWSRTVDAGALTPVFIRELESAKAQVKDIFDQCEKAYSAASKEMLSKQKGQKNKKAGEEFFAKLLTQLSKVRTDYKDANDVLIPGVYPGELEELVSGEAGTRGSYLWFEARKAEMETIGRTVYPPPKTATAPPELTDAEKEWNKVRSDVESKYKAFKADAAKLAGNWSDLNKWHELRGPYMESSLHTDAVKNTYFVMPKAYQIGGKVYTVSSSDTTGLSLKTPIPNKLLNSYAQNAISFIYHRPKNA